MAAPAEQGSIGSRARAALAWGRRRWLDVVVVAALVLLVVPDGPMWPPGGLDPSWVAGLSLARQQDLAFGPDLVFTYGPLGFVAFPLYYVPKVWLVATSVSMVVVVATVALVYGLLRRVLPWWAAALACALALPVLQWRPPWSGTSTAVGAAALAVLWALGMVTARRAPSWPQVAGAGAFAGAALLVKLDSGSLCLAALGTAVVATTLERSGTGLPGLRAAAARAGAFAASVVSAVVVLWLVLGQPVGGIPAWLRGGVEIMSGYASAMGQEEPQRAAEYAVALVFAVWLAWGIATARQLGVARRAAIGAVVAVVAAIAFRQGFVRHHVGSIWYFSLVAFMAVPLLAAWGRARSAALGAAALAVVLLVGSISLGDHFDPAQRVRSLADTVHLALDREEQRVAVERNRQQLREEYALPPALLAGIDGTVHIMPFDLSVLYAHPELRWDPLPVFQDYSAYTTELDRLNAASLAGDDRPEQLLRRPGMAIDGRVPRWEPPEATVEVACRYRPVGAEAGWVLLREAPASRCGPLEELGAVDGRFGQPIAVPRADPSIGDALVVGRFEGVNGSLLDRARTALFKASEYYVHASGSVHRFVPDTQGSWHILRAPSCVTGVIDGPAPMDLDDLTFSNSPLGPDGDRPVRVELAVIPFTC